MSDTEVIKASKKRLLLSWYIDFLFFMTLWELLVYFVDTESKAPFWLPYTAFAIIRFVSEKYIGSVGLNFLGINKDSGCVDQHIFERESKLTILLGILFILEGTKQLVRWTQFFVSQPVFGYFPDESTQIVIHVSYGILFILSGYWFLKLNVKGLFLGITIEVLNIASDALSWSLWGPVVKDMVVTRREFQGRPVSEGEIEFMQLLIPGGMLLAAVLAILAMLFTYKRFNHA